CPQRHLCAAYLLPIGNRRRDIGQTGRLRGVFICNRNLPRTGLPHGPSPRAKLQVTRVRGPTHNGKSPPQGCAGSFGLIGGCDEVGASRPRSRLGPHMAPGNTPPSMRRFCPVITPPPAEHRKAQAAPNPAGGPKRLAGTVAMRSFLACSIEMPRFLAIPAMFERSRSVSNVPGRRKLMVTLEAATERATPARKAVRPARAPEERSRPESGIFTEPEVMLTMRPNFLARIGSMTFWMSSIATTMLAMTPSMMC